MHKTLHVSETLQQMSVLLFQLLAYDLLLFKFVFVKVADDVLIWVCGRLNLSSLRWATWKQLTSEFVGWIISRFHYLTEFESWSIAICCGEDFSYDYWEQVKTEIEKKEEVIVKYKVKPSENVFSPVKRGIAKMSGKAYVNGKLVMEAELSASIIRKN